MTLTCCPSISMFGKLKEFEGISYHCICNSSHISGVLQGWWAADTDPCCLVKKLCECVSNIPSCVCVLAWPCGPGVAVLCFCIDDIRKRKATMKTSSCGVPRSSSPSCQWNLPTTLWLCTSRHLGLCQLGMVEKNSSNRGIDSKSVLNKFCGLHTTCVSYISQLASLAITHHHLPHPTTFHFTLQLITILICIDMCVCIQIYGRTDTDIHIDIQINSYRIKWKYTKHKKHIRYQISFRTHWQLQLIYVFLFLESY